MHQRSHRVVQQGVGGDGEAELNGTAFSRCIVNYVQNQANLLRVSNQTPAIAVEARQITTMMMFVLCTLCFNYFQQLHRHFLSSYLIIQLP